MPNWLKPEVTGEMLSQSGHFNVSLARGNRKHYLAFPAGSRTTAILSIVKRAVQGGSADLKDRFRESLNIVRILSRDLSS